MSAPLTSAQARLIEETVVAVPSVVCLSGGRAGEIATYLPGRRVTGVQIRDGGVAVHIVVADDEPYLPAVADEVRRAIRTRLPMVAMVDVFVDDVAPRVLELDRPPTDGPAPVALPPTPAGADPSSDVLVDVITL